MPRDSSRQHRHFGKNIPEFAETHSSVLGCERRPVSASIMSRSSFASFPVCVYEFSSNYLNNIIFIHNSLWPLAKDSPCISNKALLDECAKGENVEATGAATTSCLKSRL